jgi:hypothetical protein
MLVLFRCFVVSDRIKGYVNSSGTATQNRKFQLPEYSFWIGNRQLTPKVDKRLLEISTLYRER